MRLKLFIEKDVRALFSTAVKVFFDVGGVTSCAVLIRFPTPTILLVEEESELIEVIAAASKSSYSFAKKKAGLLIFAAQKAQTWGMPNTNRSISFLLATCAIDFA